VSEYNNQYTTGRLSVVVQMSAISDGLKQRVRE
jgi:hypothetical protein